MDHVQRCLAFGMTVGLGLIVMPVGGSDACA